MNIETLVVSQLVQDKKKNLLKRNNNIVIFQAGIFL